MKFYPRNQIVNTMNTSAFFHFLLHNTYQVSFYKCFEMRTIAIYQNALKQKIVNNLTHFDSCSMIQIQVHGNLNKVEPKIR